MSTRRVLLVDRPNDSTLELSRALEAEGYAVAREEDLERALALLLEDAFDVVLGDKAQGGEALLERVAHLEDVPAVILFDAFGSIADAVEAIRRGAFDYIARPAPEEQVLMAVRRAVEQRSLREENSRLKRDLGRRFDLGNLITRDARMQELFETIEAVADARVPVLIEGESGTGKTMLARAIHQRSERAQGPFVEVNCGALPGPLLESELFGHVKGAFTGAHRDRAGKFETADGGTLFLDEIATASVDLQVKLLRVLESQRFERVGDTETRSVDVRVLAASNRKLAEEVLEGRFREDLYYRVHVVAVEVPPLRERPADLSLLAEHFLERFAHEHDRPLEGIGAEAMARIVSHPWPGNVRQLENAIERAVLLSTGSQLEAEALGLPEGTRAAGPVPAAEAGAMDSLDLPLGPLKKALEGPERELIRRALRAAAGSRKRAAELLGINRTTLFNKMRKYGLFEDAPLEAD